MLEALYHARVRRFPLNATHPCIKLIVARLNFYRTYILLLILVETYIRYKYFLHCPDRELKIDIDFKML